MASATAKSKTVRLLDPTTVVTSRLARFPSTNGKEIQGKVRFPNSQAAKNFGKQEAARLKKALQHINHGKNIFAYSNFRTNQVVYSLSRSLDYQNVLKQLLYHGKKTIPASLRKDMWVPYFSIHFPSSSLGLEAYRLLREFSVRRQLEPPTESITNSEETLARKRPRDPVEAKKWDETWNPRIGHFMVKKDRARVLMDQKATSIADTAAVLALQSERDQQAQEQLVSTGEGEETLGTDQDGQPQEKKKTKGAVRRALKVQQRQQAQEKVLRQRIEELEKSMSSRFIQAKIDVEGELADYKVGEGEVKVLWTDLQDAQYASSWPETVQHGELEANREHIISNTLKRDMSGRLPSVVVEQQNPADDTAPVEEPAKKSFWRI